MNKSMRDALVAMGAFADATRQAYVRNLSLFRAPSTDPRVKRTPFAAAALSEAQSYSDETGSCFVLLAHLDGQNIDFFETEGLTWLANDALVFDAASKALETNADPRLKPLAELHAERVIARAMFLQSLIGGYIRALDADLFKRALSNEQGLALTAQTLAEQSVAEFTQALEPDLPKFAHPQEIVAFARASRFPNFPIAIGHKDEGRQVLNGVVLSGDLAQQVREHFARQPR